MYTFYIFTIFNEMSIAQNILEPTFLNLAYMILCIVFLIFNL